MSRVFGGHVSLIGRTSQAELAAFLVLTCSFYIAIVVETYGSRVHTFADRALGVQVFALVFAALWPLAVWRDEAPRRRLHLLSVPVPAATNVLLRVAAGLCWLLLAAAACNLIGAVIGVSTGRASEYSAISPLAWVGYALGLTIAYLLGSAIAIVSDHPGRWIALLTVLLYAPPLLLRVPEMFLATARLAPSSFYRGMMGFDTATRWIVTEAQLQADLAGFDFRRWLLAAGAWLALSSVLVVAAARRHHDA